MSATLTWTGTWTPLSFDPIGLPATGLNQPGRVASPPQAGMSQNTNLGSPNGMVAANVKMTFNFNGEQIKVVDLPELESFLQAMAAGYNITYQSAVSLLGILMRAKENRESPKIGPGRTGLYAP